MMVTQHTSTRTKGAPRKQAYFLTTKKRHDTGSFKKMIFVLFFVVQSVLVFGEQLARSYSLHRVLFALRSGETPFQRLAKRLGLETQAKREIWKKSTYHRSVAFLSEKVAQVQNDQNNAVIRLNG
jgi:hypothetical protein